MRSLREKSQQFTGENPCNGQVGSAECRRVLKYTAFATYKS